MKSFPNQIPVFPLNGVIYFPKTNLPLNIFEKRYLDLVNDSIRKDKFAPYKNLAINFYKEFPWLKKYV